jgi:ATP-dependent DNA helicase DinG
VERVTGVRAKKALQALDAALGAVPGSQERPGQRAMVEAVATALGSGEHLLVQAGTGTGKSLGYLVPASPAASAVVVATATKALQASWSTRTCPAWCRARAGAGSHPDVRAGQGSGQLRLPAAGARRAGARRTSRPGCSTGPQSSLGTQVVRLREWADETVTGDRDEVPFPVTDRAWRQVSVTARECLGSRCPDRVDCFSERAREAAKEADVVVANHTLLALDVFTGVQVLPERDAVVLDEAHEFVDSVTDALSHELTNGDVRRAVAAVTDLVSEPSLRRLESARDGLEGVLQLLQPGWVRALDRHASTCSACWQRCRPRPARDHPRSLAEAAGATTSRPRARARPRVARRAVAEAAREIGTPSVSSAVYATAGRLDDPAAGVAAAGRRRARQPAVRRHHRRRHLRDAHPGRAPSATPRRSSA